MKICFLSLHISPQVSYSLAHAYLQSALLKAGVCKGEDFFNINRQTHDDLEEIFREISPLKPNLLAISCYCWNRNVVMKMLLLLKKALPETKVALGGPEFSVESLRFFF